MSYDTVPDDYTRLEAKESPVRPIVLEHKSGARLWIQAEYYGTKARIKDHTGRIYPVAEESIEDPVLGEGWDDYLEVQEYLNPLARSLDWAGPIDTNAPQDPDIDIHEDAQDMANSTGMTFYVYEKPDGTKLATTRERDELELLDTYEPEGEEA